MSHKLLISEMKTAGLIRRSRVKGRGSKVAGQRSRVKGRGSKVAGYRSRVAGHGSQVAGHWLQDTGHRSPVMGHRSNFFRFLGFSMIRKIYSIC